VRGSRGVALLASAALALPLIVVGVIAIDARARRADRAAEQGVIDGVVVRLPSSDLALSGGARWLRFPTMEEPGAAFQDGIALPDPDPGGGAMAPPRAEWIDEVREVKR
jgi:hypothetical protein